MYYGTRILQKEIKMYLQHNNKSFTSYGCEVWQIKEKKRIKITGFGNGLLAQISKNI
jgi:hypothetical protein